MLYICAQNAFFKYWEMRTGREWFVLIKMLLPLGEGRIKPALRTTKLKPLFYSVREDLRLMTVLVNS